MKIKLFIATFLMLAFCTSLAQAQPIQASGVVVDDSGIAIIGATVVVEGTTNGTITNIDGEFSITTPSPESLLSVSFIGYDSQSVAPAEGLKVILTTSSLEMEEVVVVGYGVVKKSDLTSSIAVVKGEEISKNVGANFASGIQGKVAGVQISNPSGEPGATPNIVIRGVTTQNGSTPLYVVDGVPGVGINSINQNDIKSVEILKDAASTSIYGARGSNGVVLITTNRGTLNTDTKFNISLRAGVQAMTKPDIASASEYQQVYETRFTNDGLVAPYSWDGVTSTDWWDELIRDFAPIYDFNAGFNGGSDKLTYSGSVGYYRQESQVEDKGSWERVSARFNTEYRFNDKLKFGQDFAPSYRESESYYNNAMEGSILYDPTISILRPESEQEGLDEFSIYEQSNKTTSWNPVATQARTFGMNQWFSALTNSFLEYRPINGLIVRSQFGIDAVFGTSNSFNPSFNLGGTEKLDINKVNSGSTRDFNWVWNNTATYMGSKGKHNYNAMVGYVMEQNNDWLISASAEGVANNYNDALRYLSAGTSNFAASGVTAHSSLISYLARAQYNYDRRYYVTATYRVDGSSKFTDENRYAKFPSVSAAYNMKNEKWLKDVKPLSALRLHGGWGLVGNQNIPSGAYENNIDAVKVVLGDEVLVGSTLKTVANKDIKWEVVEDYNVGLEIGLFHKVDFSVEYFNKTSNDMLMEAANPLFSGYPMGDAKQWSNIGSMQAKGWEFSVNVKDMTKEFKYNVNFNVSNIKNTALKLVNDAPQYSGAFNQQTTHKTEPGAEIGQFFLYEADGIFQNWTEVNSHTDERGNIIQQNAQPGDLRFVDQNGDGVLDEDDKIYAGSGLPTVTLGLNANFEYKNFDLSFNIVGNFGNDIFNAQKQRIESGYAGSNVRSGLMNDVWSADNPSGSVPRLSVNDANGNFTTPSTYFLESGDYLRMQNLQLGYNFSIDDVKLRAYISAQNVFTITNYSGMDPESPLDGSVLSSGIDWFPYAQPRMYFVGLNFNL